MPDWNFEERDPRYIEQELTQRDQFNNDEVTLAEAIVREVIQSMKRNRGCSSSRILQPKD